MGHKRYSQAEVNMIVAMRLKRERERMIKAFESHMKRSMASIHLTLYQEMCMLKQDLAAEMTEPLFHGNDPTIEQPGQPGTEQIRQKDTKEVKQNGA